MILRRGNPESVDMSPVKIKHARDTAAKWVEDGKLPALVVFAARRGNIVVYDAFGKSSYIPEFIGEGKENVAVHQLLTHTSGMNGENIHAHIQKKKGSVIIPPPEHTQDPHIHQNCTGYSRFFKRGRNVCQALA